MATLQEIYNLANNAAFKGRISAAVAKAGFDITNEDPGTTYHTERLAWAKNAMKNPDTVTDQMVWLVVQNATIQSSGISSTDNDIQFVVNSNINNLAV